MSVKSLKLFKYRSVCRNWPVVCLSELQFETDTSGQHAAFFGPSLGLISDISLFLSTCSKLNLMIPVGLFNFS